MAPKRNKLGVIGHPIKHSMSPVMHNAVFRKLGLDLTYDSFDVETKDLEGFIDGCKEGNFIGLNVTIPHKVEIMKYVDDLSEEASLIGAVNTIMNPDGILRGYNTDAGGFLQGPE